MFKYLCLKYHSSELNHLLCLERSSPPCCHVSVRIELEHKHVVYDRTSRISIHPVLLTHLHNFHFENIEHVIFFAWLKVLALCTNNFLPFLTFRARQFKFLNGTSIQKANSHIHVHTVDFPFRHVVLLQIKNILSLTFNLASRQIIDRYNWRIPVLRIVECQARVYLG